MTEERYNWLEREAASRDRLAGEAAASHAIEHDRWMIDPSDVDYVIPEFRWCRVCGQPDSAHPTASERIRTLRRNAVA